MKLVRIINTSFVTIFLLKQLHVFLFSSKPSRWLSERVRSGGRSMREVHLESSRLSLPANRKPRWTKKNSNEARYHGETGRASPPLSNFIDENMRPTNQTSDLLDFVIGGFPSCGTSSLGQWLGVSTSINRHNRASGEQPQDPMHQFYMQPVEKVIRSLHSTFPFPSHPEDETDAWQGIWAPDFLRGPRGPQLLREYFPNTKLVVAVRSPFEWFESHYARQGTKEIKFDPKHSKGGYKKACVNCPDHAWSLSTRGARFHQALARLRKTSMVDTEERSLLSLSKDSRSLDNAPITNNAVFFIETTQLRDTNATRLQALGEDLQDFLGLTGDLPFIIPKVRQAGKEGLRGTGNSDKKPIDACSEDFEPLRFELLEISRNASLWFRKYFLNSEGVSVSSRVFLEEILEGWMKDPCEAS